MTVITTRKSTAYIAPTDLPVKHFILGKNWGWRNREPYTFIDADAEDAFRKKLAKAGRKLPPPATPGGAGGDLTIAQLRAAPVTVTVGGVTMTLRTHLWRDFMPGVTRPGRRRPKRGLLASIKVVATDAKAIPPGLVADTVWLIKGDEVWTSPLKEVRRRGPGLDVMVRNGPAWPTGIKVDVVVRLRDKGGKSYLLRAAQQPIKRTS